MTFQDQVEAAVESLGAVQRSAEAARGAAAELGAEIDARNDQVDQAEARVRDGLFGAADELGESATRVESRVEALLHQIEALRAHVREAQARTAHTAEALGQRVTQFEENFDTVQANLDASAHRSLDGLGAVEAASLTVSESVDGATHTQEQFLAQESVAALQGLRTDSEARTEALRTFVLTQAIPTLQEKTEAFAEHLLSVAARVSTKVEEASAAHRDAGQAMVDQAHAETDDQNAALLAQVETTATAVVDLAEFTVDTTTAVTEIADAVGDGAKAANVGVTAALGVIRELLELFQKALGAM